MINFVKNEHIPANDLCIFCGDTGADATVIVSDDDGSFLTRRPHLFGVHRGCWRYKAQGKQLVKDERTLAELEKKYGWGGV